jgi:hypothetical protein
MAERIQRIEFEAFRGLKRFQVQLEGRSLVVCGANGRGKSAIVDGMEFFLSGDISRFKGRGMGGLQFRAAVRHVDCERFAPTVTVRFTPCGETLERALGSGGALTPSCDSLREHLRRHPPAGACILRRGQILDFLTTTDADRYARFTNLLGLNEVADTQSAFNAAVERAKQAVEAAELALSEALVPFRPPGGDPATSPAAALAFLSEQARRVASIELRSWGDAAAAHAALSARGLAELPTRAAQLRQAEELFSRPQPRDPRPLLATSASLPSERGEAEAAPGASALDLLEAACDYLERSPTGHCPVCEEPFPAGRGREGVLARLTERRAALAGARRRREQEAELAALLEPWRARAADAAPFLPLLPAELRTVAADLIQRWDHVDQLAPPRWAEGIGALIAAQIELEAAAVTWIAAARSGSAGAAGESLLETWVLLKRAAEDWPAIAAAQRRLGRARQVEAWAQEVRAAFSRAREAAIQDLLDAIAGRVADFYRRLHDDPDETGSLDCHQVVLKASRRAASGGVSLAIQFYAAEPSPPKAFLSEGHEDSLGLCIFLAIARTFNPAGSLLVLDDVLTSIDSGHRNRVADLLLQEFSDYQLILTTHDEAWYQSLQAKVHAIERGDAWRFQQITNWTRQDGPGASLESAWQYVHGQLTPETFRYLGGPLRLLFEEFLKAVAERLEVPVHYRRSGRYTAGDFLTQTPLRAELRKALLRADPESAAAVEDEYLKVFGNSGLLNELSHDRGGPLSARFADVADFARRLQRLEERCRRCGILRKR